MGESAVAYWVVAVTIQVSVVVAVLSVLTRVARRRIGPRWLYGLWLLVFLRLAVPWTPMSPTSLYQWLPGLGIGRPDAAGTGAWSGVVHTVGYALSPAAVSDPQAHGSVFLALAVMWFAGVVLVGGRAVHGERRFRHAVQGALRISGVAGRLPIWETPAVPTPAVVGVVRPRVLVPPGLQERLTGEQWQQVLTHEQSHVAQGDLLVRWVLEALCTVYWFHPAVWFARRRTYEAQECVADAAALATLPPERTAEYGHTLLTVFEWGAGRPARPYAAGIAGHPSSIGRRIEMIHAHLSRGMRWGGGAAVLVGVALMAMAMTAPVGAASGTVLSPAQSGGSAAPVATTGCTVTAMQTIPLPASDAALLPPGQPRVAYQFWWTCGGDKEAGQPSGSGWPTWRGR